MLTNYIKTAVRTILRQKGYSLINITGLAVGMAVCILILLYVRFEISYDTFHERADDIYMVISRSTLPDKTAIGDVQPGGIAAALDQNFPEVVMAARAVERPASVSRGDKAFNEVITFADPSLLEMFTFPLISGDAAALADPRSMLITETMADKYFPGKDALGETLTLYGEYDFKIAGILRDAPGNSTIDLQLVLPLVFLREQGWDLDGFEGGNFRTFVMLQPGTVAEDFGVKVTAALGEQYRRMTGAEPPPVELRFHPFTRLHLYSLDGSGGLIRYIYVLIMIAIFVMAIACINFVNLATARSTQRAREIGVRKAIGADRVRVFWQFMFEALVYSGLALVAALMLVDLVLPGFRELTGRPLSLAFTGQQSPFFLVAAVGLLTGLLSGCYPALVLSSIRPAVVLKSARHTAGGGSLLRKALVVMQFALSVFLAIGALVVTDQLGYLRSKDLGLRRENVIYAQIGDGIKHNFASFQNTLLADEGVTDISTSVQHIFYIYSTLGNCDWEGRTMEQEFDLHFDWVAPGYIETLGMEMAEGRSFSRDFPTDTAEAVILNERAVALMGLESPVGKRFSYWGKTRTIVGVVKDFHFQTLRRELKPIVLICSNDAGVLYMRLKSEDMPKTLAKIEDVWQRYDPGNTFEYRFLDAAYERVYRDEQRLATIAGYFTGLAVFISCLGLFGLAAFTAERRTREIGIRKIVGASIPNVIGLLSREFVILVIIANVIAWPIAYLAVSHWLESFAYRTAVGPWIFVISGLATMAIAVLTVMYQAVKAALTNPVEALRHE